MSFSQSPTDPTLWLPDTDLPGEGAHALVIGVSDYPGLDGSDVKLGLDSLFTSALTAFTFFEWLTQVYHSPETPLKSCRLLLAPTTEEVAVVPELGATQGADFGTCVQAVEGWFTEMQGLFGPVLERSRSIFFFSGHGLQATTKNQILLPSDYLATDANRDAALSTQNLKNGLEALNLRAEFYFLDACRSRMPDEQRMKGHKILDEPDVFSLNPDHERVVLYATKAGTETWQGSDPAKDISIFGRALMEGLTAADADAACRPSFLSSDSLYRFVRLRTVQLMSDVMNRHIPNSVTRGGQWSDGCFSMVRGFATPWWTADPAAVSAPLSEPRYSTVLDRGDPTRVRFDSGTSFSDAHLALGSETLTEIWRQGRLLSLDDPTLPSVFAVEASSVFGDTSFAMDFMVEGPGSWLLELNDNRYHWFVMLPAESVFQHMYEARFTRDGDNFSRFEVGLSAHQPDPGLRRIVEAIHQHELGSARAATGNLADTFLEPGTPPLAAVLRAAGLMHSPRALATFGDAVLDSLSVSGPLNADRTILGSELQRRLGRVDRASDAEPSLLADRWAAGLQNSPPFLAEVFEMAISQLDRIERRGADGDPASAQVIGSPKAEAFRRLEAAFNPGGLFTSFATSRDHADAIRGILIDWRHQGA